MIAMDCIWIGNDMPMNQKLRFKWQDPDTAALHNWCMQGLAGKCMIWDATQEADLAIDRRTCVLPLCKTTQGPVPVLHLFGGSWGGWSFAGQILSEMGFSIISGAIEIDYATARSYAISHRMEMNLPPLSLLSFPESWCLCANALDPAWYEAVAFWGAEIVSISAPCPPWSGAAHQRGLHCSDGQLLLRSIALCKVLQPKLILLEQVAAFHFHPHRAWIQRAL